MGEGRGRTLPLTPHPPYRAPFSWVEGFPCNHEAVDSATPGKPCVQNDMGVRRQNGRSNQFIKVYSYKLHDMNRSCSLPKTEANQKPMHIAPDPLLLGFYSPKTLILFM